MILQKGQFLLPKEDTKLILDKLILECISDFRGNSGSFKRQLLKHDDGTKLLPRAWGYSIYDDFLKVQDGKVYNQICIPLYTTNVLLKFKRDSSSLTRMELSRTVKRLNIKEIKPIDPSFKHSYGGLLTVESVSKILRDKPFDFDVKKFQHHFAKLRQLIDESYGESCLIGFWTEKEELLTNCFDSSVVCQILTDEMEQETMVSSSEVEVETRSEEQYLNYLYEQPLLKFFHTRIVYCIKYLCKENFYYIGSCYTRELIYRLQEHQAETGKKPVVVFAYKQISRFNFRIPSQLEDDLHMLVMRDLIESGFTKNFDLPSIKKCGSHGFYYPGTEADLTRICSLNVDKELIKDFRPLTTLEITSGNLHFQNKKPQTP
jgi:hypothetical protein